MGSKPLTSCSRNLILTQTISQEFFNFLSKDEQKIIFFRNKLNKIFKPVLFWRRSGDSRPPVIRHYRCSSLNGNGMSKFLHSFSAKADQVAGPADLRESRGANGHPQFLALVHRSKKPSS